MSSKKEHHEQDEPAPMDDAAAPADAPAAPASPLDALRLERDDLLARLQRLSADYVNYQKRVQRDIAQARDFANEDLIKSLIGVLDDMERALAAARENHAPDDPLLVGMQLVHDKAMEAMGRFGLTVIPPGGKFNPDLHQALLHQPSDEHPPMTIITEVQKGYRLKGRTIRPSSVVVSKAPEPQEPPDDTAAKQ